MALVTGPIRLVIDSPPVGKGRPRVVRGRSKPITPTATRAAEQVVRVAWLRAGRPRLEGAIFASVELVVARPGSHWKQDGTLGAAGLRTPYPLRKPDIDNALKLYLDALNKCAYDDDAQVVEGRVLRRWASPGENEHVVITLAAMFIPDMARAA